MRQFEDFPLLTLGMVALLWWFYAVQLMHGWPLALVDIPPDPFLRLPLTAIGSHMGWLDPASVRAGEGWRLLSMTFLHQSFVHIAGNTIATYFLGRVVESVLGRAAWIVTWVGGGLAAAGTSLCFVPGESLGASGAALALLGAAVGYGLRHRKRIPADLRDAFGVDLWVFVLLVSLTSMLPMVNWAAHLGGLLFGLPVGWFWQPRSWGEPLGRLVIVGRGLAAAGAGIWLATLGVVGTRLPSLPDVVPHETLRAIVAAEERGDRAELGRLVEQLVAQFPQEAPWAEVRAALLLEAEEWEGAVQALRELASRWPEQLRSDPMFHNNLAWALLMAAPDDPIAVQEAVDRARASLRRSPGDDVIRNTLAYALVRDGQASRALELIRDILAGKAEEERGQDIYIEVLALAALGRSDEARERWDFAHKHHPDGTLHQEAEAELRRRRILD